MTGEAGDLPLRRGIEFLAGKQFNMCEPDHGSGRASGGPSAPASQRI
jgi:hypothetical protein